ncbi:methyltransferase domain-containing protein [Metabacillus niabensis]|uniref:methyltransferase domain-containing protein n=1 Tax=Metabacillus niabensis TaxID=324854 RepID=UPI001CFB5494|nr:methyltransferase domain-containing protein [Metabacillus niabensis]
MNKDLQFSKLIQDGSESFSGWDFSYITDTDRVKSDLLSWSYGSMAKHLIGAASSMLDMGTGGGEFLSLLRPFPRTIFATEGYKPNVKIAKKRLEPLGVKVVAIEDDNSLPFANDQFDLLLNKHESYSPKEVRRVVSTNGVFLTQQVGGTDCLGINEGLEAPYNHEFENWNVMTAKEELENSGFEILFSKEEYPIQRFYDVGALVYYLKAIPWQIPDFDVLTYEKRLLDIHKSIQTNGFFDVKQHRFILKARAT